jgi:hypothetical protein
MKVIITDRLSVARAIARVVGATEHGKGYMHGNDYAVCCTSGHLVGLAMPEDYGLPTDIPTSELPFIPEPFRLVPRLRAADRRYAGNGVHGSSFACPKSGMDGLYAGKDGNASCNACERLRRILLPRYFRRGRYRGRGSYRGLRPPCP